MIQFVRDFLILNQVLRININCFCLLEYTLYKYLVGKYENIKSNHDQINLHLRVPI